MHIQIKIIFLSYLISFTYAKLDVVPNSLLGTENLNFELSDKQLAISKYLAWLTILQNEWKGWEVNYNNDQRYLQAVRYPLSFIGYTAAALVYKTPGYRELSVRILENVIQRLLEEHQFKYIEVYWKHEKTFPDPVAHENIMYSGHLAMLMALYESISGDLKYSNVGWDFTWNNGSFKIHYTLKKLMNTIANQVISEETGGVACEPNSIFVICNNHHRIAYLLYDAIHQTNFSNTNKKWEEWLIRHGRAPDLLPDGDYRYFRIIYYKPIHEWIPLYGTSGNDAWALTFINSWIQDKKFASKGYEQMLKSHQWRQVADDQEYLDAGYFGKLSEMNTWLASSLFISVENQYSSTRTNKSIHVLNWFERRFALFDENNCNNSYIYRINDTEYQIWTTANLLLSMITDNNTFYEMYNEPFFIKNKNKPELINIDYPNLHVKYAYYHERTNSFKFGLKTDCSYDIKNSNFSLINVLSFSKATLTIDGNTFDITSMLTFNANQRSLNFSSMAINSDYLNLFHVYF